MTRKQQLAAVIEMVEAGIDPGFQCWVDVFYRKVFHAIEAFNGSLDAAKALHEAVLPGMFWNMGHLDHPSLGYVCTVAEGHFPDSPSWRGFAATPARAWLLSILRALHAMEAR